MFCGLFSRVYVINLKERADRRREMAAELQRVGRSFADPDVTLFEAVRPDDAGSFPSLGARGCFLSHLGVLEDARARGEGPIAIIEDDAAFCADFATRAEGVFAALGGADWGLFYGGYESLSVAGDGLVGVPHDVAVRTTHFICFNSPAIAPAAAYLEAMLARPAGDGAGGPMHVDGAYSWFRRAHPQFSTFAAAPPLAGQRRSRSDIRRLHWYDRLPLVRSATGLARRLLRG